MEKEIKQVRQFGGLGRCELAILCRPEKLSLIRHNLRRNLMERKKGSSGSLGEMTSQILKGVCLDHCKNSKDAYIAGAERVSSGVVRMIKMRSEKKSGPSHLGPYKPL